MYHVEGRVKVMGCHTDKKSSGLPLGVTQSFSARTSSSQQHNQITQDDVPKTWTDKGGSLASCSNTEAAITAQLPEQHLVASLFRTMQFGLHPGDTVGPGGRRYETRHIVLLLRPRPGGRCQ